MSTAIFVSIVALWIAVVVLAAVVFALARQLGVLYERVAPAGALVINKGPAVGERAPNVQVEHLTGTTEIIGSPQIDGRSTLLFFLSPTCPICKELLPVLRSLQRDEDSWVRIVLAGDGAREEHAAFVLAEQLDRFDYVVSAELGITYRVAKLPYAVLIDGAGTLRASGLVNTREHLESLFEASARGVASIQELFARERERAKVA